MQKSTHRLCYRVLAGMLSLVCLFSLLMGTAPAAFAASAEYPENIELLFLNKPNDNIIISEDERSADFNIPDSGQQVDIRLRISLNKKYEEGQLSIIIPYNAFKNRNGEDFHMTNKIAFPDYFFVDLYRFQKCLSIQLFCSYLHKLLSLRCIGVQEMKPILPQTQL